MFSIETLVNGSSLLAEVGSGGGMPVLGMHLLAAVAFSIVGVAILGACFWGIKRIMPFSVTKEIEEDQNVALAIIIASVILGLSIIIAAAILG